MTYGIGPANAQSSYLSDEFQLPADEKGTRELIAKRERLTASILNIKETAQYELQELLNGQQWFSTESAGNQKKPRYAFRTVFDLVSLNGGANIGGGVSTFAHGLTGIVTPTRIFGTATATNNDFLPLPYVSVAGSHIEIFFDTTNITINNNYGSSLIQCYVTFEYTKS